MVLTCATMPGTISVVASSRSARAAMCPSAAMWSKALQRTGSLWLASLLLVSFGCSEPGTTETRCQRIIGGSPVQGDLDSVVWLSGGCSGTLVHERLILYAGHCGEDHHSAYVGDTLKIVPGDTTG